VADQVATLGEALDYLADQDLLTDEARQQIESGLKAGSAAEATPWYFKLLIGIGAWIAALFFIGFTTAIALQAAAVWGLVLIAAAVALNYYTDTIFTKQLALATSIAGHIIFLIGLVEQLDLTPSDGGFFVIATAVTVLWIVLYRLYRLSVHRFLSTLLVPATFTAWIISEEFYEGLHLLLLVEVIGIGVIFLGRTRFTAQLLPAGYALVVAVLIMPFLTLILLDVDEIAVWPARVILSLGFIFLVLSLSGDWRKLGREPLILAVGAIILLALLSNAGIIAATGLLVLGFARRDLLITAAAQLFLLVFISFYYYDLHLDLLEKSAVLAASGIIIMGARMLIGIRPWTREVT
jgi:hypothetical protein